MRLLAFLALATLALAAPKVETGSINGAAFRIDVPENWNGGLVVYCHGYSPKPGTYNDQKLALQLAVFTDQGFAVAQSGYATGGWAIQEAIVDTEALRRYFVAKYGKPKETYITGHSMGGFLTMMTMETNPTVYDAGMPLCGPLAAPVTFMSRGAFDGMVLFNFYFPGILPDPMKIPADFVNDRALQDKIETALDAAPEKAAALRRQNNLKSNKDLASTMAFVSYLIKELQDRAGGNPFDNRNVIYSGTLDDNAVNSAIPRYTADPKAIADLHSVYSPTGRIQKPMLAIHTSYDPLVPVNIPNTYESTTQDAGTSALFVQQFVKHDGHCAITPGEIASGFSQLRNWKSTGTRPRAGEVPQTAKPSGGGN